ncbi:SigB/SigF/SigG family RNA polymerase sigma factor [Iocasia frigidifontis]|uniref:SigB/SigF/SigG family RNA polymerase sigma factor n=1 Tax=Iocasia fonsfrigidae TaxID=2682810 RepID=A0A8A7KAJ9_9FIRM|nr:SigB/SigF/SigG family RNA polymerase sigma factor [Iocasia fonsfrigidae]QTL98481.1 SigB/SigF/SigG family RNA polymerase sigma factor [Iocasia fonsfrigidae]
MNYSMIDLPDLELLSEEETRYYIRLAQQGDKSALEKVVEHNLRLVLKVSYRFKNSGYDLQDLFQVGVIGIIKAVEGFDLERGIKFSTYAVAKIIGEIRLHLRDDGLIKVSRSLKKIARVVRQKEEELSQKNNQSPSISELASETGYSREDIIQALEADKNPASIYQTINPDSNNDLYLLDSLANKSAEKELDNFDKLELVEVLRRLDKRSRKIIFLRYFEDKTQQEIAEEIGVSQVQVSRLEKKILKELRMSL